MDHSKQFAPGVAEAFAAQGADVSGLLPEPAAFKATFLSGKSRSEAIPLEWPLEANGVVYDKIVLKRMTSAEVAAAMQALDALDEKAKDDWRFPIYFTEDGQPVPAGLFAALDEDDSARLHEAAASFLPRRFQRALEIVSTPASGEPTAP